MKFVRPMLLCALIALSGCQKNLSSNVYTEGSVAGKVLEGKIISARPVTIKAKDKLQDNTTGGVLGAGAGLAAGSAIGNGSGNTGAMVGGAILGAIAGAMIEDAASTQEGMEYLVKIDKKYRQEYRSITKRINVSSKQGVNGDIVASTDVSNKSDIVSVVQAAEPGLGVGKRVYIIYSDDRPRITPNME